MPKVSILLTTYNRPDMLKKALYSIESQTFKDYELIILDDNSDDARQLEILKIYEERAKTNSGIILIRSDVKPDDRRKTTRYAVTINMGLKIAKGEYITYLCDDDYYMPTRLEKMVNYLNADPNAMIVYGSQQLVNLTKDENGNIKEIVCGMRPAENFLQNAMCVVDHSSVMHRRIVVDKVGYWQEDPAYWGQADGEYWTRMNSIGYYFYPIKEVLDCHVFHDGSWTAKRWW